ncbi:DUF4861 family protein [Flavobacterium sp. W22_SRS_FK3]|uniref:DUF4861 family protein n=1 Tax=Flavobacterium sp. W22_SRS_FK3 TaxID=3240275 RepID=UPI003F91104F
MKNKLIVLLFLTTVNIMAQKKKSKCTIVVKNTLSIDRFEETISLSKKELGLKKKVSLEHYTFIEKKFGTYLITQVVDQDGDGIADVILAQPEVKAYEEVELELVEKPAKNRDTITYCYSRFVPERTDDYAWENNKVAFRTYGPKAQEMVENNIKGGTLTSGIDAWLKRVEYPIINKWYAKTTNGRGSYHKDTGEGLDNFHVGDSRGIGGIAIKIDTTYYFSKNFITWKTITTGSLRTSFRLTYAHWNANGQEITETKLISLDYGSYLSKYEIELTGSKEIEVGLTLHDKKGNTGTDLNQGWLSYWEPLDDSQIGTGIVVAGKKLKKFDNHLTDKTDLSNLYGTIKLNHNKATYYAGFGWKKAGHFNNEKEWESYLADFALKINTPLKIRIKNK